MVFTGTHEHSIDAKNRLAIPADIRQQIISAAASAGGSKKSVCLVVIPGEGQSLFLYTEQDFEKRAAELDDSELDQNQLLEYEQFLFSTAERVEIDAQGRVLLPEKLLKMAGLSGSEVVLLGVKDHLEVRDRKVWYEQMQEKLRDKIKWFINPRRAMRRPRPGGGG